MCYRGDFFKRQSLECFLCTQKTVCGGQYTVRTMTLQLSEMQIPTYIPLKQAARKYKLSIEALTQLIQNGRIEAAKLPSGEIVVSETSYQTKEQIIENKFKHLKEEKIGAYAASKKYNVAHQTLIRWSNSGYIARDKHKKLNEADVAYCVFIYNEKKKEYGKRIAGAKIFDEDGNPYQVKFPDLSLRRRMVS